MGHNLFISYSHADLAEVQQLEQVLHERGISLWRDQEKLYAGEKWPKALGDAIAATDAVLLVWSAAAAQSEHVEMEWCTAIALNKTLLPYRLDETPLPSSLQATHSINAREPASARQILQSLSATPNHTDAIRTTEVLKTLGDISSKEPTEVLKQAKAIFVKRRWTVVGDVYQAEGDIHITHTQQATAQPQKTMIEKWQIRLALIVAVLGVLTWILDLPQKIKPWLTTEDTYTFWTRGKTIEGEIKQVFRYDFDTEAACLKEQYSHSPPRFVLNDFTCTDKEPTLSQLEERCQNGGHLACLQEKYLKQTREEIILRD